MRPPRALPLEQLRRLPPEALALELLARIPDGPIVRRGSFLFGVLADARPTPRGQTVTRSEQLFDEHREEGMALVEAWQRLVLDGLIVDWPPKDPGYNGEGFGELFQLTRWGRRVRASQSDGRALVLARRRLGVDLHPALADRLRDSIAVGAFEQAALLALRTIEARVRELCGDPRGGRGERLTGVPLMQKAFAADGGPLADPDAEPGERVGTMNLFSGAFGAIRNALVHTEVEWSDSVEAAEYVLLADLLMRMLDRAEGRMPDAATG